MAFYDNFFLSNRGKITKIGKLLVSYRNFWFLSLIKRYTFNQKILEIGPGRGDFARKCIQSGFNYTAIEINKKMSKQLNSANIHTINSKVPPIKLKTHFDIIFSNQVFEHMSGVDEAIDYIKSCRNTLADNGILVISCPEITMWQSDFFGSDYTHNNPTSLFNITQILEDNNFNILYSNHYTLVFSGYLLCKLIATIIRMLDKLFILDLLFQNKAYKIKTVVLPSFVILAKKEL